MTINSKLSIYAVSLSAAAFVALVSSEGWTDRAVIPVKGDVPTVGPGLTKRPDGSPVQMGDTITPVQGVQRSLAHIQKSELALKKCITAPVSQAEYDILVDFAYQYGENATCKSSMVKYINQGEYALSCGSYLNYRFVAKFDCSTPGNKQCPGVWTRSKERHTKCLEAQ